jgi:hypothetical protein
MKIVTAARRQALVVRGGGRDSARLALLLVTRFEGQRRQAFNSTRAMRSNVIEGNDRQQACMEIRV